MLTTRHLRDGFVASAHAIVALAAALALGSCAHAKPAASAAPVAVERLDAANRLLDEGCLDCLLDAYRQFDTLRQQAPGAQAATAGAARAALLVAHSP